MRIFFRATGLLAAAALAWGTAGCGGRETAVAKATPARMLLLGNRAEPRDLDPHIVTAVTDCNLLTAVFEGLTVLDETTMVAQPGVAERWEISGNGLVYTFHLRESAKWSDGHPVTADDFVYSFRRILSPALASEYSYMLYFIKSAEAFNAGKITDFSQVGVAASDPRTLRVTLERPTAYLLAVAAHPTWLPVDRRTIEKYGKIDQRDSGWTRPGRLVGNGPFMLAEWTQNARIVVKKNPQYWDAANNHLEGVTFFPIETGDIEERDFRAGQLHMTYDMPSTKIAGYRAEHPAELRIDPSLSTLYVNFNTRKAPFDNEKVRRAFSLSVDRAALAERVMNGAILASETFVAPHCGEYVSNARVPTDFAAARQLLADAGYPNGKGFPAVPLQILNDLRQTKIAEAQQAIWQRELGVRVTIEPSEQKTWLENQKTMTHTFGLLSWIADFPDPYTFLAVGMTGNGNNWSGWSNAEYDQLVLQAQNTVDTQARFSLLQKAEALLLQKAPFAPVGVLTRSFLIRPEVKHYDPSPLDIHLYQRIELAIP